MGERRTGDEDPSTMTRNNSRQGHLRNHIIPIFHMRQFAQDDLVYTYDFEEAKKTSKYSPPRQSVNNATVFKGFYTDEQERRLAEQFEQGIKVILEKMNDQHQLTPDERQKFCRYIYAYRTRTHWMLKLLQDNYVPNIHQFLQERSEAWSFTQKALYDMDQPIDDSLFETVNSIISRIGVELNDPETVTLRSHSFFSDGSMLSRRSSHADRQLATLPWRVFV